MVKWAKELESAGGGGDGEGNLVPPYLKFTLLLTYMQNTTGPGLATYMQNTPGPGLARFISEG